MLALTLVAALAYSFPEGQRTVYDLTVNLEGYLPLLGRVQNQAEIQMALAVVGGGKDAEGNWKASYDVAGMKATMGGVSLPFTAQNVKAYFPKANLVVTELGRVLKSDAPATNLPIRIPGLDTRRLPEISFLPLEFPAQTLEAGQSWTFRRKIGEGEIEFTATPTAAGDGPRTFEVKLRQTETSFGDAAGGRAKEENAAFRVESALSGTAKVTFDPELGAATQWDASYETKSQVIDQKTKQASERVLKTKVSVVRRKG